MSNCNGPVNWCQAYCDLEKARLDLLMGEAVTSVSIGSEKYSFQARKIEALDKAIAEAALKCGKPMITGGNVSSRISPMGVCFSEKKCAQCGVDKCGGCCS